MNLPGSSPRRVLVQSKSRYLTLAVLVSLGTAVSIPSLSFARDAVNAPEPIKPAVVAQIDVDFGPYMADLQKRIKKAWSPIKGTHSRHSKVSFKVHSDGSSSDLKMVKSTGDANADTLDLQAVADASPFRPLPSGAPEVVDIEFTFDYHCNSGADKFSTTADNSATDAFSTGAENDGRSAKAAEPIARRPVVKDEVLAETLAENGMEKLNSEHQEDALPELERLFQIVSKKDLPGYTDELSSLGDIYYENDEYSKALPVFRKVQDLLHKEKSTDTYALASAKRDIAFALLYADSKNVDEAEKNFRDAQSLSNKIDDLELSRDIACGIGHCLWQKHQFSDASKEYQTSADISLKCDGEESPDYCQKLKNVADCKYKLHEDAEALEIYQKVERIDAKIGHLPADEDKELHENIAALRAKVKPSVVRELAKQENNWWYYAFGGICTALVLLYLVGRPSNSTISLKSKNSK